MEHDGGEVGGHGKPALPGSRPWLAPGPLTFDAAITVRERVRSFPLRYAYFAALAASCAFTKLSTTAA
jgi:hypothetical protein